MDRQIIRYTPRVQLGSGVFNPNPDPTLTCRLRQVWMPNVDKTEMNLTHELNGRNINFSIPITDPDFVRIKGNDIVNIINADSVLGAASSGISVEAGPVAAIRMPMLRVCNFKWGDT